MTVDWQKLVDDVLGLLKGKMDEDNKDTARLEFELEQLSQRIAYFWKMANEAETEDARAAAAEDLKFMRSTLRMLRANHNYKAGAQWLELLATAGAAIVKNIIT